MKLRRLAEILSEMSDEQLEMDVIVYDNVTDKFRPVLGDVIIVNVASPSLPVNQPYPVI